MAFTPQGIHHLYIVVLSILAFTPQGIHHQTVVALSILAFIPQGIHHQSFGSAGPTRVPCLPDHQLNTIPPFFKSFSLRVHQHHAS